jgi:Arc/MetJ family transcription regulator
MSYLMRTTVDIDPKALREAGELLGETSVSNTVNVALRELVRLRRLAELSDRIGRLGLIHDWRELEEVELKEEEQQKRGID